MRVGLATPYGARPATAAFATLYETLVMMAAGGLIAAARIRDAIGRPARAAHRRGRRSSPSRSRS